MSLADIGCELVSVQWQIETQAKADVVVSVGSWRDREISRDFAPTGFESHIRIILESAKKKMQGGQYSGHFFITYVRSTSCIIKQYPSTLTLKTFTMNFGRCRIC